jgi:hypothetical protein
MGTTSMLVEHNLTEMRTGIKNSFRNFGLAVSWATLPNLMTILLLLCIYKDILLIDNSI